jgi:hypothetical protein
MDINIRTWSVYGHKQHFEGFAMAIAQFENSCDFYLCQPQVLFILL